MHRKASKALGIALVGVLGAFGSVAFAHHTGHECRTHDECNKQPNTNPNDNLRLECNNCVAENDGKPKPAVHWHPDYEKGKRCRPDDGKP